jgi:hypothetical protein
MTTKKTSVMPRGSGICNFCQRPVGVDDFTSGVEWIDGVRHIIPSHNDCIDIAYRRMEEEYYRSKTKEGTKQMKTTNEDVFTAYANAVNKIKIYPVEIDHVASATHWALIYGGCSVCGNTDDIEVLGEGCVAGDSGEPDDIDTFYVCASCMKHSGDIDRRLERHAEQLEERAAKTRGLIGRLEMARA